MGDTVVVLIWYIYIQYKYRIFKKKTLILGELYV